MDMMSLKYIGVGLTSLAMLGAALGVANIFASLLSSIARNPSVEQLLVKNAFIGAGFAEAMGLFALILALLMLFVV